MFEIEYVKRVLDIDSYNHYAVTVRDEDYDYDFENGRWNPCGSKFSYIAHGRNVINAVSNMESLFETDGYKLIATEVYVDGELYFKTVPYKEIEDEN